MCFPLFPLVIAILIIASGVAPAADVAALATAAGGSYDAATGAIVIKGNKELTPAQLGALAAAGGVKRLTLDGCKLTSEGVAVLPKFTGLTAINFTHTMVNKVADLKVLASVSSLEELDLGGSDFGDDGLVVIATLKNLTSLQLGHVGRSPKAAFTANGLKALAGLPKLEKLTLHLQQPDDAMIPALASLKTVKEFKIGGVNTDFFNRLKASMPQAKVTPRGKLTDAQ
ncbi:MAG: hypothetical protein WCF18_13970 [Chthoniobacteraceae bacterium]